MADIEKVIKGLEHCRLICKGVSHNPCNGCPYQGSIDCADKLKTDALSLLNKINKENGALKLTHEATLFKSFTCPHCKNVIRDVTNKEEEFDCPYCGQRLKK